MARLLAAIWVVGWIGCEPSELWRQGEPNNGFGAYQELATSISDALLMNDEPTASNLGSLCECDGRPAAHQFMQ